MRYGEDGEDMGGMGSAMPMGEDPLAVVERYVDKVLEKKYSMKGATKPALRAPHERDGRVEGAPNFFQKLNPVTGTLSPNWVRLGALAVGAAAVLYVVWRRRRK